MFGNKKKRRSGSRSSRRQVAARSTGQSNRRLSSDREYRLESTSTSPYPTNRSEEEYRLAIRESANRRKQKLRRKALKRSARRKRRFRFFLGLLVLAGLLIGGRYFIKKFVLTDSLSEIPDLRAEANRQILDKLLVTDSSGRMLTSAEKEADIRQLEDYLQAVPIVNAPGKEAKDYYSSFDRLKKEAIASESDQEFFNTVQKIVLLLDTPRSYLVDRSRYEDLVKESGHGFFEPGSAYERAVNHPRVKDRYQRLPKAKPADPEAEKKLASGPMHKVIDGTSISIIDNLSFTEQATVLHADQLNRLFEQVNSANSIIIDLRNQQGYSNSYWAKNILPYISTGNVGASTDLYLPSAFDQYLDYLSIREEMVEFDLQDDREAISMLIPQSIHDRLDDLDFQKKITYSSLPSDKKRAAGSVVLLIDETTGGAAETFADFCIANGIADVAGRSSSGTGWSLPPFLLKLDHSGLLVALDIAVPINRDKSDLQRDAKLNPTIVLEGDDILQTLVNSLR